MEPEEGFEPSTFRLRAKCSASEWTEQNGNYLLTLGAASIWSGPDGPRRIVWMTIEMTKAHSILRRMAKQATQRRSHSIARPMRSCGTAWIGL
jgi:hypothetical protein